ncbi:hypothetical protein LZ318_35795 [Saccharopolyspora indica]|uniref:hypothetical protein n=1 Tax=Saccharopolyspora indica TaxID=1229659 RepID=UPI0022EAFF5A|nr:hypothetical protein [Saccharopolyspora indica]MDA3647326.1 hypothetical protein [Saccharopolyspora indica]
MHPQQPGSWGPPPGGQYPQQQPIQQPYPQAPQGYPQPPQKKRGKRIGLIVGICLGALVLLGAGGFLVVAYLNYTKPAGDPPTNAALPEDCDLVGGATLKRLHVTNPEPIIIGEDPSGGRSTCGWGPTRGQDGNNQRTLRIDVRDLSKVDGGDAKDTFQTYQENSSGAIREISGIGDEAFLVSRGADSPGELNFREGQKIVTVGYSGWNRNFLGDSTQMSSAEGEKAVLDVAGEIVSGL